MKDIQIIKTVGDLNVSISKVCLDSRQVEQDSLFVAIKGLQFDGHKFIPNTIEAGAKAIICEELPSLIDRQMTYVVVESTAAVVGLIASANLDYPTTKMKVVGVTGTNGKTTVSTLLYDLFSGLGFKCGLISTVHNKIGDRVVKATHTTPDAVSIQNLFKQMLEASCAIVFMEVSSHAIHQGRSNGIDFDVCVFTNITHDHLDYHGDFKEYIRVKKLLFDGLDSKCYALSNADDTNGDIMLQNCAATKKYYSLNKLTDYKAKILQSDFDGMLLNINSREFYTTLVGRFNVYNLLAAYGVADVLDIDKDDLLIGLSKLQAAEGRLDLIRSTGGKLAIVDYAHTPDALENVLKTIRSIAHRKKLITVIGCGGDRDKTKRPLMAKLAVMFSDLVFLTSDNPRSEDPNEIIADMLAGVEIADQKDVIVNADRIQAIKTAVMMAKANSVILVAGKGHEKYQEIKGVKIPFDDKQILKALLLEDF